MIERGLGRHAVKVVKKISQRDRIRAFGQLGSDSTFDPAKFAIPVVFLGLSVIVAWLVSVAPLLLIFIFIAAGVIVFPAIGIFAALTVESTKLLLVSSGIPVELLTAASGAALALTAVVVIVRRPRYSPIAVPLGLLAALVVVPGTVIQISSSSFGHVAATMNLLLTPILAAVVARSLHISEVRGLQKMTIILLVANALACIWEFTIGSDGMLALGLEYGTTVRHIDGVLRTPGLTMTNSAVGLLAGAVLLWIITSQNVMPMRIGKLWRFVGILSAITVLILSTSRSGMIFVIVGALIVALHRIPGTATRTSRLAANVARAAIFATITALPFIFLQYGAGSAFSLFDRFRVWGELVQGNVSFLGMGAGRVGASSYSDANSFAPIFVDNSWLSILLQFGVLGFVLCAGAVTWAIRYTAIRIRRAQTFEEKSLQIGTMAILWSLIISALVIEILDYPIAMILIGLCVGAYTRADRLPGRNGRTEGP